MLSNGLNLMAVPSSVQVASIGLLVIVALLHRRPAEPRMTDIAKTAIAPPARRCLSQDAIQLVYRLLAALLICAVLAVLSDVVPDASATSSTCCGRRA